MKLRFEANARKNMEHYERELAFKYSNDDNETIKYLKETILKLENKMGIKR